MPQLKSLWLACFREKEEAAELFLKRNLSEHHGYCAVYDGSIIAALYLIGCTLCGKPAHYLCGAATLPAYRKQGVMRRLIDYALRDAAARGDCYSALLPADEGLYGYYARLGYLPLGKTATAVFDCREGRDGSGEPDYTSLQKSCHGDKFLLWNNDFLSFAAEYYACYGVQAVKSSGAYALWEQDGDAAAVFYAAYYDIKELKSLLYARGVRRFTLTGSAENPQLSGGETERCGMLRALRDAPLPDSFYIGITLD